MAWREITVKIHPLRDWLQTHGRTQQWLADELGISLQAVNGYVTGYRQPSLTLAAKIEELTGIPAKDLALSA